MWLGSIWITLAILLPTIGHAQTDLAAQEASWTGKKKILRNYSADPVAVYSWSGDNLLSEPAAVRTLGLLTIKSVNLSGGKLVVLGDRQTLVSDKQSFGVAASTSPMRLEIDLHGGDVATISPRLEGALFFPDVSSALASLPSQVASLIPYDVSAAKARKAAATSWVFVSGKWSASARADPKLKMPKPISLPDPRFSDEAKKARISGYVDLAITLLESGRVGDIWIEMPAGFGLDVKAIEAVRQYRFRPASYDGVSVGLEMSVEVNFNSF